MAERTTILDGEDIDLPVEDRNGEPGEHGASDQGDGEKDLMQDEEDTDGNV